MRRFPKPFLMALLLAAHLASSRPAPAQSQPAEPLAARLFAQANATRAQYGLQPLRWDPALAQAALRHCQLMAARATLEHVFPGEPDPAARAAQAQARFNLFEENIAYASDPERIHPNWLNSPGHRRNLLAPEIDSIGVAVVRSGELYYAVADYARAAPALSPESLEGRFAQLLAARGLAHRPDPALARRLCRDESDAPAASPQPALLFFWQGSQLPELPEALERELRAAPYRSAAIGACPASPAAGPFPQQRVAVLLYR